MVFNFGSCLNTKTKQRNLWFKALNKRTNIYCVFSLTFRDHKNIKLNSPFLSVQQYLFCKISDKIKRFPTKIYIILLKKVRQRLSRKHFSKPFNFFFFYFCLFEVKISLHEKKLPNCQFNYDNYVPHLTLT